MAGLFLWRDMGVEQSIPSSDLSEIEASMRNNGFHHVGIEGGVIGVTGVTTLKIIPDENGGHLICRLDSAGIFTVSPIVAPNGQNGNGMGL